MHACTACAQSKDGLKISGEVDEAGKLVKASSAPGGQQFVIPEQLRQSFVEVPSKQRLMVLAGLLRQKLQQRGPKAAAAAAAAGQDAGGVGKVVVFISSCDGVELHHKLLGSFWAAACGAPLLAAPLYKLHGDMPQSERTATFVRFSAVSEGKVVPFPSCSMPPKADNGQQHT